MKTSNLITGIALLAASAALAAPTEQQGQPSTAESNNYQELMESIFENLPIDAVPDDGPVPQWTPVEGLDGRILGWVVVDDDPTMEDYCRRYLKQHKVQPGNIAAYTWPYCKALIQRIEQGTQPKQKMEYILAFPNNAFLPEDPVQGKPPAQGKAST